MVDLPLSYIPYIALCIAGVLAIVVLWFFLIKPRIDLALSNETDEGYWRVPLPQLGKIYEGKVCTARRTQQSLWAKLIDNTFDPVLRANLVKRRDGNLEHHFFAQKVGGNKVLYIFNVNPLDPENHIRSDRPVRFGPDVAVRFICNVRDCKSSGKGADGFEHIAVKLGKEHGTFTELEHEELDLELETNRYLRLAATNTEAVKHFKILADDRKYLLDESDKDIREVASERDTAKRGLRQKPLTEPEAPALKQGIFQKVGKWFTGWQLFLTAMTYFIAPNLAKQFNVQYPEPGTLAVGLAVAVFVAYPFIKGILKR